VGGAKESENTSEHLASFLYLEGMHSKATVHVQINNLSRPSS